MELLSIFLPALVVLLALYLLNKAFNYKEKLANTLGTIKYKVTLLTITLIIFFIITYIYESFIFRHPIGLPLFWSYLYLVNVPNKSKKV